MAILHSYVCLPEGKWWWLGPLGIWHWPLRLTSIASIAFGCCHPGEDSESTAIRPPNSLASWRGWLENHLYNMGTFGGDWNMTYIFPYICIHHPNWRTHIFQRGWNHQPDGNIWANMGTSPNIRIKWRFVAEKTISNTGFSGQPCLMTPDCLVLERPHASWDSMIQV